MSYIESNSCDPCYRTSALLAMHVSRQLLLNAFCHSMDGPHYGRHCTFCLWVILCEILGEDYCSMSKRIFWYSITVKWSTVLSNLTGSFFFFKWDWRDFNVYFLITTQCLKGAKSTEYSIFFLWCCITDRHFVICSDV